MKNSKRIVYVLLVILIALTSLLGVYVKNKNTTLNTVKAYTLGYDLDGVRNIVIKVDDSSKTKTYDAEGNEVEATEEQEGYTTKEIPVNEETVLTQENYLKVKKIIEQRLKYLKLDFYEIRCDQDTGMINIQIPNNSLADYIAQYSVSQGVFKISDNETDEVLIDNSHVEEASVKYYAQTSGTTVYLEIKFDQQGTEKLKEISNTYIKSEVEVPEENSEEVTAEDAPAVEQTEETSDEAESEPKFETVEKQIKMTIDDTTIITTSFDEEISDGILQLTLGTSTDSATLSGYAQQGTNIAVLLNAEPMPIQYKMDTNILVHSSITQEYWKIALIMLGAIEVLILVCMIIRYKNMGIWSAIISIGFIGLLLLSLRYANVVLTLGGCLAVVGIVGLENWLLVKFMKLLKKEIDHESKQKVLKEEMIHQLENLIPILVISIVFSITQWQAISSIGMVMFWGIAEIVIWNFISLKMIKKKEGK